MRTIINTYEGFKEEYKNMPLSAEEKNLMQMMEIALSHPEDWASVCGNCINCGKDKNGFPACLLESPQLAYPEGCYMYVSIEERI